MSGRRAILLAVLIGLVYMYPVWLSGTLGVLIREDLGLNLAQMGSIISLYFAVGTLLMPFGGRIADGMGPRRSIRLSMLLLTGCLLGVGVFGYTWVGFAVSLALGGVGSAIAAPIGTLLIVHNVDAPSRPIAFGLERSSLPASTLLAGLAVPTLATVMEWRLVFVVAAVLVASVGLMRLPRDGWSRPADGRRRLGHGPRLGGGVPLVMVSFAFFLCSAASTALSTFFVDFGVVLGFSQGSAGVMLALGSGAVIVTRLGLGLSRTRRHGRRTVAAMMALGAIGFLLLSSGVSVWALVGTFVAYAAGWGWTGLVSHAVADAYAHAPGAASGVLQAGGAAGGIVGPLLVGAAAQHYSYSMAWGVAAVFCAVSAVVVLVNRIVWQERT